MVVQKTINNLKQRPEEDKKVIAGGIAIAVVSVLLIAWVFLFLKRIQTGEQSIQLGGGIPSEFDFSSVEEAQKQLQQVYFDTTSELRELRDAAVSQQVPQQAVQEEGDGNSQFGTGE
jgi:hypothetical protein